MRCLEILGRGTGKIHRSSDLGRMCLILTQVVKEGLARVVLMLQTVEDEVKEMKFDLIPRDLRQRIDVVTQLLSACVSSTML